MSWVDEHIFASTKLEGLPFDITDQGSTFVYQACCHRWKSIRTVYVQVRRVSQVKVIRCAMYTWWRSNWWSEMSGILHWPSWTAAFKVFLRPSNEAVWGSHNVRSSLPEQKWYVHRSNRLSKLRSICDLYMLFGLLFYLLPAMFDNLCFLLNLSKFLVGTEHVRTKVRCLVNTAWSLYFGLCHLGKRWNITSRFIWSVTFKGVAYVALDIVQFCNGIVLSVFGACLLLL